MEIKRAKVVEKYKVMCPHCLKLNDASSWAVAHYNIEISFTCPKCEGKSILPAYSLGGYGGRGE